MKGASPNSVKASAAIVGLGCSSRVANHCKRLRAGSSTGGAAATCPMTVSSASTASNRSPSSPRMPNRRAVPSIPAATAAVTTSGEAFRGVSSNRPRSVVATVNRCRTSPLESRAAGASAAPTATTSAVSLRSASDRPTTPQNGQAAPGHALSAAASATAWIRRPRPFCGWRVTSRPWRPIRSSAVPASRAWCRGAAGRCPGSSRRVSGPTSSS